MLAIIQCRIFCLPVCYPKSLKIKIYRTIILPVVLYGCETWSLTLREERRLSVFENRVLRRVFGPKRDEVTGNGHWTSVCSTAVTPKPYTRNPFLSNPYSISHRPVNVGFVVDQMAVEKFPVAIK